MKEPRSPAAARVHAAEVILDRGWGKSTQLIAPADNARLGFSEIKLVIIDTAQQRQDRVIEHDDTRPEPYTDRSPHPHE
jgi:hypothetical protein